MQNTQRLKTIALITMLTFTVSACASKPFVATTMKPTDRSLSCKDLSSAINTAMHHKQMARQDDRFQWRYILIIPAMLSVYNWTKAEKAADKRIKHLEGISRERGCLQDGMGGGSDMMRGNHPSYMEQQSPYGQANGMMQQRVPLPQGMQPKMVQPRTQPVQPPYYTQPYQATPSQGNMRSPHMMQPAQQPPYYAPSPTNTYPGGNAVSPYAAPPSTGNGSSSYSPQSIYRAPQRYQPSARAPLPRAMPMQQYNQQRMQLQARNRMMQQQYVQPQQQQPYVPSYTAPVQRVAPAGYMY